MEKNKTLSEVYKNSSDEVKEILKNKFSNEELGIEFIPKDGDIYISNFGTIFIANGDIKDRHGYGAYCTLNEDEEFDPTDKIIGFDRARLATEEEKQKLFDVMQGIGYQWNEEEKKIEKVLWRAKEGKGYYFISSSLCVESATEVYDSIDLIHYKRGNYFRTKEEAELYLKKVKDIFKENYNNL